MAQTSDGFLWLSSFSQALYRFDGVHFLRWPVASKDSSTGKVFKVFADRSGSLWAVSNRQIFHFKSGRVAARHELEGLSSFQNISEDPDGSIWVVRAASTVSDSPLCRVTDEAVKCFGKSDGIPISPIDSILADGRGGFWLGGQTAIVHWHQAVSQTYPIASLKSNVGQHGVVSLALAPDGTLWAGILAEGPGLGLGQLRHDAFEPFVTPDFDGSKVEVYATLFDRDGNLWVSTRGKGVFRIHGNAVDHYGRTDGLSGDAVQLMFEDREGNLWVATADGIDTFQDPRVTTFSASEGLGKDVAVAVLAARDGSIWIAGDGSLDRIADGTVSSIRSGHGLPGHQVTSLLEDRAGKLWVGVDDGLYLFENGRLSRLPETDQEPLGLVVGLAQDVDGDVWAECVGKRRRLVRIRDFRVREEFPPPRVPAGRILAPDPHGGIWIGTTKGDLVHLRRGVFEQFPLAPKGDPAIHQILANADGSVLATSEDGLIAMRQSKVQRLTMENGLPCTSVISLVEDNQKRWWLYTSCGLVELPDSELQRWWSDPKSSVQVRVYDQLDGVRPNAPFFNPAAISKDGRVWFANGKVVQMVDPTRLPQRASPAATLIESLVVDRKGFPAQNGLKVPPLPRDLQIAYTSPTFTIPQKVKFRYRLDPNDIDWHDADTRRQAFYTDLPPGRYSFRVMAANSDGVWNQTPATFDFSVTPAYYQTNGFRSLCLLLLLAIAWAAYRWRVRQLQRQFDLALDARVGERTRIARELHDTLLQSFHGVLLRFQAAFQLLPERALEAKEVLGNAIEQAAGAITEGRDAVQGLRESTVEANDLAIAIRTLGEELVSVLGDQRPAFRVVLEGESRNLHPIVRDEIYKIGGEALRNAFQHANARNVEVEIRYGDAQFRLRVRDDGKGIDPAILARHGVEGHYGLRGMQERADVISGRLSVWSDINTGTELELSIPAGAAYATTVRRGFELSGRLSRSSMFEKA